jgi:hypothetical protein
MAVLLRMLDPVSAKCPRDSRPSEMVEESRIGWAIPKTLPLPSHLLPEFRPRPGHPLNCLLVLPLWPHCATPSRPLMTKRRSSISGIRRNPSNNPLLALQVPCPALAPFSLGRRNSQLSVPVSSLFQLDPIRFYSTICLKRLLQCEAFLPSNLKRKRRRNSQGLRVGLQVIIPPVARLPRLRSVLLRGWSKRWRTSRERGF